MFDLNLEKYCVAKMPRQQNTKPTTGSFILEKHVAVCFKTSGISNDMACTKLLSQSQYDHLQAMAESGHFVILEAWTMGKCISN